MTAIRRYDAAEPFRFTFICDDCGHSETKIASSTAPKDWPLLWRQAHVEGWRGRDRPIGPHRCPRCEIASTN